MGFLSFFSKIKKYIEKVGLFVASIFNFIFLLPVYFISVGLTSLFVRLANKDILFLNNENRTNPWAKARGICRAVFGIENCRTKVRGIKPTIFNKQEKSYWKDYNLQTQKKEDYHRMF